MQDHSASCIYEIASFSGDIPAKQFRLSPVHDHQDLIASAKAHAMKRGVVSLSLS